MGESGGGCGKAFVTAPRSFISSFSTSALRVNFYHQKYTSLTLQRNRLGSILRPQQWKLGALPIESCEMMEEEHIGDARVRNYRVDFGNYILFLTKFRNLS